MRNTNVPPMWRAYAQLNRAVRISPTCGVPVGEGQNRTRTSDPVTGVAGVPDGHGGGAVSVGVGGRSRDSVVAPGSVAADDRVAQDADLLDLDLDDVAVHDRPDAGGGAGEDDVARAAA